MILYSIVPPEIVFGDANSQEKSKYVEGEYLGEKIQALQLEDNKYVITRLLSTFPGSFLRPELQPGNIITDLK